MKKIEVTLLRKSTSYLSVFNTIFNSFLFYVLWELENLHVDGCIYVIIYTFAKLTFFVRYKWQHIQILKNRNFGLFRDILSKKLPMSSKKLWQNPSIYLVLPFLPFFCLFWEKNENLNYLGHVSVKKFFSQNYTKSEKKTIFWPQNFSKFLKKL